MKVVKVEIEMMDVYDYVVENDNVEKVCDKIKVIVFVEYLKCECVVFRYKKMLEVE